MAEVINSGMRKGIKIMCVVAQTAQFVSLMPKPQDFVTRFVGDVVYLSTQVQKLSEKMNKLLDEYSEIPSNYLMTQMNSITGSLSNITNRLNTYAQNGVDQVMGLGENVLNMVTEVTGTVMDASASVTGALVNLGSAVGQASADVISSAKGELTSDIYNAEAVFEWTNDGFKETTDTFLNDTLKINDAKQWFTDKKTLATDSINKAANAVTDKISETQQYVEKIITNLRDAMKGLSDSIDGGVNSIGLDKVSAGADELVTVLKGDDSAAAQLTGAMAETISKVIKEFSIGKVVTAFAGILSQTAIVGLGLDQLPPIDFESMLCQIRDDMEVSVKDLYKQYKTLSENTYNDIIEFDESISETEADRRNYSQKNYEEFKNQFTEELKKQRDSIRTLMKGSYDKSGKIKDGDAKSEMVSVISKMRSIRKSVKNAKQAKTFLSIIKDELNNLKKEVEYRSNSLKSDWMSMMDQYKKSIDEIKSFFQNGGSCDMYIDDVCDDINKACDEIKELCKSIGRQLGASAIKVFMPSDIGACVPNPGFKIPDFLIDIMTIIKFIKDLITLVIRIINDINKLARLMLNGLNSLKELISQLMDLVGLKWLMDLIQSIINLLGDNITNSRERLQNTLTPVHFSDTEEYENTLDALDAYLENNELTKEQSAYITDAASMLHDISGSDKNLRKFVDKINEVVGYGSLSEKESDKIEELIDELDERGETIVAYKSPILEEVGESSTVSDLVSGATMDTDIKFIGWHFFHPNLDYSKDKYYGSGWIQKLIKKIKSKIIKKASKNGHKKKGGVNQLKRKVVGTKRTKIDVAYDAFYWYTYYTEDLEKDCFEKSTANNGIIVDSVIQTQNGSIVEVTTANGEKKRVFVADANVRKGDYVTVEGVRYRVDK